MPTLLRAKADQVETIQVKIDDESNVEAWPQHPSQRDRTIGLNIGKSEE